MEFIIRIIQHGRGPIPSPHAEGLTKEERRKIAAKAAAARWR